MENAPKRAGRRDFVLLTVLLTLAYFVSYISRINLAATMVEVVSVGFAPKQTAALALSATSITYGAFQILSGYLGDRCKPQNVMLAGFLATGAINLSVFFLQNPAWLVPLWALNGVAQALMYPPITRILAEHFEGAEYSLSNKYVGWGSAVGTIAVYGLSPVIINAFSFRHVFLISGTVALAMAAVWKIGYERNFGSRPGRVLSRSAPKAQSLPKKRIDRIGLFFMGTIMLAIVMQGMLRDGVSNWTPTLVSESFHLDSSTAILSGVLLPIFHILCTQVAEWLARKAIRNELLCSGLMFLGAVAAALLLGLVSGRNVILSVVFLAMIVGCMHGVNFILICLIPPHYIQYGHVSLVSGTLNSSTYLGAAISTYGIALLSEAFGWTATILIWAAIATVGAAICLALARRWGSWTK